MSLSLQKSNLAHKLEVMSGKIGKLKPYSSMEQIETMADEDVLKMDSALNLRYRLLSERTESIFDFEADRREFLTALDKLKLSCSNDIVERFEDGDVIEIYDRNMVQVYHNWVFHYYCSYDLLTLLTQPLWQLYSRPQEINERIIARFREIMPSGGGPVLWDVPVHYLKETKLRSPRMFEIVPRWICPVSDSAGRPFGLVSTIQCTPVTLTLV